MTRGRARWGWLGLAAALLAAPGLAAASEPSAARPGAPVLEIVDSLGQVVGPVVGGPLFVNRVTVALAGRDRAYLVEVTRSGLFLGTSLVGFEAPGCAGPSLLFDFLDGAPAVTRTGVGPDGRLMAESGPASSTLLGSTFDPFQTPPCQPAAAIVEAFPTAVVLEPGALAPPLRPRLRPPGVNSSGPRRSTGLVAVDAIGQSLGPVHLDNLSVVVILREGRRPPVAVNLLRDGLSGSLSSARFQSTDCSGPALVTAFPTSPGPMVPVTAVGPGNALHGGTGSPFLATIRSAWSAGLGTCLDQSSNEESVLATTILMDLSRFVPPFTVR